MSNCKTIKKIEDYYKNKKKTTNSEHSLGTSIVADNYIIICINSNNVKQCNLSNSRRTG